MGILKRFLRSELDEMMQNGIRFQTIGRIEKLPGDAQKLIRDTIKRTSVNENMTLSLALSYGGRQEILHAVKEMAAKVQSGDMLLTDITEKRFARSLDPDLLIRTSGEYRISNFLLWQIAYAEIHITPVLWPDFRKKEYLMAIEDFQSRERRFGAAEE